MSGDILLAVDGRELTPETTVQDEAELVRGEQGTDVVLTVLHEGSDTPVSIKVTRATILLPSVTHRILDEDSTIGYIRLVRFTGESGQEIENAVMSLLDQGAEKLILDLRYNGGGLRNSAVEVSDHFLDGGIVVIQQSKDGEEEAYKASRGQLAEDIPLAVLVNEASASAAEIVAGALQDRDRAILIGQPTYGKGSVQLVFDLSDGSSVHVTSARWLTPDRRQLDVEGLQPDISVELTTEAVESGIDEVLGAAIDYFQER